MKQIKRRSAYFSGQAGAEPGSCFEFVGISSPALSPRAIAGGSPGSPGEAPGARSPPPARRARPCVGVGARSPRNRAPGAARAAEGPARRAEG